MGPWTRETAHLGVVAEREDLAVGDRDSAAAPQRRR
jgi:hypothetical protein